ncbi:hypothetical protein ACFLS9_09100 [Bacteroidota bacterium]
MKDLPTTNLIKIMEFLDGELIHRKIDKPLDEVFRRFSYELSGEVTLEKFNLLMVSFLEHLSDSGIRTSIIPPGVDESYDIIWLTENYYRGYETWGYEGVLFDITTQGNEGIDSILENIIEAIKVSEREKYISYIIIKYFAHLEWDIKKEIITKIFNKYGHFFPPQLMELEPHKLVPRIKELINLIITTNQTISEILNRSKSNSS